MAPPPNEDDDENDADANIVDRCCRVIRGESCKKFGLCWLLLLFSFFMIGSVLLFLGRYAANPNRAAVGRPLVSEAADENVAEEAEEFGTSITELAEELKDEALEAEVVDPAAFQGSNDDAHQRPMFVCVRTKIILIIKLHSLHSTYEKELKWKLRAGGN